MNCGLDYETLVTSIPSINARNTNQCHFTVPSTALERFNSLVGVGMSTIRNPLTAANKDELEQVITAVTAALTDAVAAVGKPARGKGYSATWWTDECRQAHKAHLRARRDQGGTEPAQEAQRNLKTVVRNAKREYWRQVLDNAKDDTALYKVIAWHKLEPNN